LASLDHIPQRPRLVCAASSIRCGTMDAIDFLLDKLRNTKNNGEFFDSMNT
jgi:transcription termination factor Rho